MEKELEYLLGMMDYELFYEWSALAHEQIANPSGRFRELNPDFPARVQAQYAELLRTRPLTKFDYSDLTGIHFEDDDALYEFLSRAYQFIFEDQGQGDPPHPPWD
ncbi:hypothetical protein ACIP5Y_25750 [Nocardia sp. NPDC088792]|uniref:hypothetical protein n=1 Tax=Nocardia sp. NPDC088792 TaxID=3364332 RepID=UPI0037FF67F5